jgi:hypothetical protein
VFAQAINTFSISSGSPASPKHSQQQEQQSGQQQQQLQQQQQQQQLQEGSHEKVEQMSHRQHFVVPGPEEMCPAGEPWGTSNRWIEAWDDAAGENSKVLLGQAWRVLGACNVDEWAECWWRHLHLCPCDRMCVCVCVCVCV